MKLIMEQWRSFLVEQQPGEIKTIADLQKVLSSIERDSKFRSAAKTTVGAARDTAGGLTFGLPTLLQAIWDQSQKNPKLAKSKPGLDKLVIDRFVSMVVDDKIEKAFIKDLAQELESLAKKKGPEAEIGELDMTKMLAKYIAKDYDGTIVAPPENT